MSPTSKSILASVRRWLSWQYHCLSGAAERDRYFAELAESYARVAHRCFRPGSVGSVADQNRSIVFAKIEENLEAVLDAYKGELTACQAPVLASTVWPSERPQAYAIIIDHRRNVLWAMLLELAISQNRWERERATRDRWRSEGSCAVTYAADDYLERL